MGNPALAEILGYEEENRTPVEIIERGLPYDAVERLIEALDLTLEDFCHIVPVSRRTLARYRGGSLDSHLSDHVLMVGKVYERAAEVLESQENAIHWLKTPNYTFRFKRPLDYLSSFTGAQEVLDELGRLQHGIFV
ncbi:antitoxin Xre/MbcA/ParS toxin-binding domain-containing protein [Geobacter sp. DSM 9736]|uniref:type II RES/Xre toxin-antitoxin system antitoxin n=1 Tax=Geobacter sp. DSM 9736 TaxID=1277350 RepID=UPI000B508CBF|nr:antitoxin Xre/MbcA/ParS toxin-binding domain-containing protein [Geobacter sp. DSM 9736]SNB45434.1 putative toxin-antitoxin system antitoxin component, TIGR02293 family [Geobacter sp. DSM 9736]